MTRLFKNSMANFTKKLKNILDSLQKNYFTPHITGISIISLILLIKLSPILSIIWLNISTLYFMYIRNYKDIIKIWSFTIGIWYLIFTTSLSDITILIGFEHTKVIINYLLDNDFMFETLCFQTVYILDGLSAKLGFSIYIPAVTWAHQAIIALILAVLLLV
jgi:hypothetical protein